MSARRVSALERIHAWAAVVWLGLIGGGGLGFVVRDLLGAGRPLVALAWVAGAASWHPALARRSGAARGGPGLRARGAATVGNRSELGQATIEWVALVLACALALGALAAFGPSVEGRSFGASLAHRMVCAVRAGCD